MRMRLRTTKQGDHTKVTVFVDGQNAGTLAFKGEEYEPFLLTMVGGASLLKQSECNQRVDLEVDDRR